jgi:nucleoside 2-deoxyribosyltransferase
VCLRPEQGGRNRYALHDFADDRTTVVHNGVMATKEKTVRQSITLPEKVATQVRSMAKRRRLSANRMLIELLEDGLKAQKEKEKAFFELAKRFRAADDPKEAERLGEELGQMVFGR